VLGLPHGGPRRCLALPAQTRNALDRLLQDFSRQLNTGAIMNSRAISLAAALTLAGLLPLTACSRSGGPTDVATATATSADSPATFIGQRVEQEMAKARAKMIAGNIDISRGIDVHLNGQQLAAPTGATKAEITPQGDLLIAGKPVAVTSDQRALLVAYRSEIIDVASAGMALGSQGADIGISALSGLPGVLLGGKQGQQDYQQRMESEGRQMKTKALALCQQLPSMLTTQQQLAASLPEFKPYATMTQRDIDDCRKDLKERGVAASGN